MRTSRRAWHTGRCARIGFPFRGNDERRTRDGEGEAGTTWWDARRTRGGRGLTKDTRDERKRDGRNDDTSRTAAHPKNRPKRRAVLQDSAHKYKGLPSAGPGGLRCGSLLAPRLTCHTRSVAESRSGPLPVRRAQHSRFSSMCVWSLRQPLPSVAGCDLHRTYRNTRARSANFFAHHIATTYASQGLRRFVLMSVDARQRCLNVACTATQRGEERRSEERVHVHR
jgi:hypothetical protein